MVNWAHQPRFWCKHAVDWKKWWIQFGVDSRTEAGKIYGMVDRGTGTYVGGMAYPITPNPPRKALAFPVPSPIKTTPGIPGIGPGLVRLQGGVERGMLVVKKVMHPGIRPRHFQESLLDELNSRTRPGGLRSTTDAAVKRAWRKVSSR